VKTTGERRAWSRWGPELRETGADEAMTDQVRGAAAVGDSDRREDDFDARRVAAMERKIDDLSVGILSEHTAEPVVQMSTEERLQRMEANIQLLLQKVGNANQDETRATNQKRKKPTFVPLNLNDISGESYYPQIFTLHMSIEDRTNMSPYQIRDTINSVTGSLPLSIAASGVSDYTIKVRNREQSTAITKITKIGNINCKITKHPRLNSCRGIVYIYNYDMSDFESFELGLKEDYPNIEKVEKAEFLGSRNSTSVPLIVEFNEFHLPSHIQVPGESALTKVIPFKPRPMRCKKCQKYGHTQKRCNHTNTVCGRCAKEGHEQKNCTSEAECCAHCTNNKEHKTGDKACPAERKEREIIEIMESRKIGRSAARQMLSNQISYETQYSHNTNEQAIFASHLLVEIDNRSDNTNNETASINPFTLRREITVSIGNKPKSIRAEGKKFSVEISTAEERMKMLNLKTICNRSCQVIEHPKYNHTKGIIYTYSLRKNDVNLLSSGLINDYPVTKVENADWIKPKSANARAYLITFIGKSCPEYVEIPGEQAKTRVYLHIPSPMRCMKCQQYQHTIKHCSAEHPTCGRCARQHETKTCRSLTLKCAHCSDEHTVGHRSCPKHIVEREIITLQTKRKISRSHAMSQLERENPSYRLNYAKTLKSAEHQPRLHETRENIENFGEMHEIEAFMNAVGNQAAKRGRGEEPTREPNEKIDKKKRIDSVGDTIQVPQENVVEPSTSSALTSRLSPPTPDHLTSENDYEIRQQARKIFHQSLITSSETCSKIHAESTSETTNNSAPATTFKRLLPNTKRKYRRNRGGSSQGSQEDTRQRNRDERRDNVSKDRRQATPTERRRSISDHSNQSYDRNTNSN